MRYYIYLDKCFLRSLFAIVDDSNFNIEVVEYSIRKSNTVNNQLSVDPHKENILDEDKSSVNSSIDEKTKKSHEQRKRDEKINKCGIDARYGTGNSSTIETERRYINIEDITDMKNGKFYHELIRKLETDNYKNQKRIIWEEGYITLYNKEESTKSLDDFFILNEKYIWYNTDILQSDIKLLTQTNCKIKVVGFVMNCLEKEEKVIKAIAMFIE